MSSDRRTNDLDRTQREPLIADTNDSTRRPKEESIRRKLRTYETFLALRAGYLPSSEQITAWLRYALGTSSVLDSRNRRLSAQGRTLVRDLRAWVEAVVDATETKNGDDKIQDFIYHTSKGQALARMPDVRGASAASTLTSSSDIQQLYSRLRLLGSLLYSSPEFRKMVSDFSIVARDIFADAASSVASYASNATDRARPSEEQLSQIDKAADTLPSTETAQGPSLPSTTKLKQQAAEKSRAYADTLRSKGYETTNEIQEYLKQKFPKQRRDAVINRFKKVITDIQENPDFQDAAEFIIQMAQDYVVRLRDAALEEGRQVKGSMGNDEHFEEAMQKGKDIITAFANGKSPDPIKYALAQVIRDVQGDLELSEFYSDVTSFLHRLLVEPNYATTDAADAEAHSFYDRSKQLLDNKTDKYRPDIERLFDELNRFITAIKNDKVNRRVVDTSKKVFLDIMNPDGRGGYKVKIGLVRGLLDVVLPRFISEIKYIPLPRVEYQDKDYDVIMENVVLESEHFLPHRILFEAHTRAEYLNEYSFTSYYSGSTRLRLDNINLFIKDASFIVRKKTGLIPFSDKGFIDLLMDGPGISADITLDKASYDEYYDDDEDAADSYFHVQSVKVKIHRFSYKYNAYHSWAASLLSPIIKPMIRKMVARLLEDKIKETFSMADRELHSLMERVRVANIANQGGGSLESWVRAVLSKPSSSSRRGGSHLDVSRSGITVRHNGANKKTNGFAVTIGAEEVLFPGEHGPGAITVKFGAAEERVESQRVGGWRNEIFDVKG